MQTKTSSFRQSGWKKPGTSEILICYGADVPGADSAFTVKIWDTLVTTLTTVEPHPDGGMMAVDESHSS